MVQPLEAPQPPNVQPQRLHRAAGGAQKTARTRRFRSPLLTRAALARWPLSIRCFCLVALLRSCSASVAFDSRLPPYLPCGADTPDLPRVVINSHVAYERPLRQLLHSLVSVGFRDFCRVAIVVGGAASAAEPERVANLTMVHMAQNSYDYTGLDALNVYKGHPLLDAQYFVYLHDTCFVHPRFVPFFSSLATTLDAEPEVLELFVPRGYHSNIFVFRGAFIKRYSRRYHHEFTKDEALKMELHHHVERIGKTFITPVKYVRNAFSERITSGNYDIYGTGVNRSLYYYPDLGVFKLIFMHHHGDIEGHIE
jgi:hypothetical protein